MENRDDNELSKALDASLTQMSDLIKSKSDDKSLRELCSNPENRKALKKLMKEYSKDSDEDDENEKPEEKDEDEEKMKGKKSASDDDDSEEDSEDDSEPDEDEEKMKDDEDEDSEDDEEEGKKKLPPFIKKKLKKSLDNAVEGNEEVIDAVPVLKSFVEVLHSASEEISSLRKSVSSLEQKYSESLELQKSFASVLEANSNIVKSFSDEVSVIGSEPKKVKGQRTQSADLLTKSFTTESGETKSFPVGAIRATLLKSFQDGLVDSKTISRWEMSNYRMDVLPANVIAIIEKQLSGGEK